MQRFSLLTVFFFGLLFLILDACQPADSPAVTPGPPASTSTPANRVRIKSLSQDMPNNARKITAFTYDAQGRLSSLLSYESPDSTVTWIEKSSYQYDVQNRLIQHQYQQIARPNSIFGPMTYRHQYSYTSTGQLSEIRYAYSNFALPGQRAIDLSVLNNANTLAIIAYPRYNASGQVLELKKVIYQQGQQTAFTLSYEFSYTGSNVTSTTNTNSGYQGSVPYKQTDQYSLTFDDKINPFYGLYVIPKYYGGINDYFLNLHTLSPNNVRTIGGLTYRYEYNEANLPTVRYTYSDKLVETLRFDYESY
ncbi:hypothetical protein [Spirosoma oryzicola]|uniref:hypothetical protein n=1 Tax=Spirosoma oryzicola TaxID=2898794 RepID=UPI001E60C19D|nr:hypothetical protein [Spirosoma oryzicola]UHG90945.1 hypothetical protein LQ777_22225 [Spirosoma oryzicola]